MCIPFTQLKTGLNSLGYPYVKDAEVIRTEREDFKLGSSDKARTELISEIYGNKYCESCCVNRKYD